MSHIISALIMLVLHTGYCDDIRVAPVSADRSAVLFVAYPDLPFVVFGQPHEGVGCLSKDATRLVQDGISYEVK